MKVRNAGCLPTGKQFPCRKERLAIADATAELVRQPRLPHPRLGHEIYDTDFSLRLRQALFEQHARHRR